MSLQGRQNRLCPSALLSSLKGLECLYYTILPALKRWAIFVEHRRYADTSHLPDVRKHVPPKTSYRVVASLLLLVAPHELEKADRIAHRMDAAYFVGVNRRDWD